MTDRTHTVAEWSESPYTDYERRGAVVQHRVRLAVYHSDSLDVLHQVRGDAESGLPLDWTTIEALEFREGSVSRVSRGEVLRA